MSAPAPDGAGSGAVLGQLAARLGRHQSVFVAANLSGVFAGFAMLAVLARSFEPSEFGDLAVVLVIASIVTVLSNAGTLQGTFATVWGTSDDGDDVEIADPGERTSDPRRALTTGLVMTAVIGSVVGGLIALLRQPIADALLSSDGSSHLVGLAGLTGALGAVARLTTQVLRLERRPAAYLTLVLVQGFGGVLATGVLLLSGVGIEAALIGIGAGHVLAAIAGVFLARAAYVGRVSRRDGATILRRGRPLVPLVLAFQTIQLGDVLLVARTTTAVDAGHYRIASRFGALAVYWTASFHMAWGPLRRDPLHAAADGLVGRKRVDGAVAYYYVAGAVGVLVFLWASAPWWVGIAGPGYEQAADFVPAVAANFVLHGLFVLAFRVAEFREKRTWFIRLAVFAAAVFVAVSLVVVPAVGPAGVTVGAALGYGSGILALLVRTQRGPTPVVYPALSMATVVLGGGTILVWILVIAPAPSGAILLAAIGLLVHVLLTAAAAPRRHRRVLRAAARALPGGKRGGSRTRLGIVDRALLQLVTDRRLDLADIADLTSVPEQRLAERVLELVMWAGGAVDHVEDRESLARLVVARIRFGAHASTAADLARVVPNADELVRLERAIQVLARRRTNR